MSEFILTLQNECIDIACITETHFTSDLFEAEVTIPGYNIFRQDRNFKLDRTVGNCNVSCGGGSIIYVRNNINVDKITSIQSGFDSVAILMECNIGKVLLSCIYRSPSLSFEQDMKLLNYLGNLIKLDDSIEKVFIGDFNLSNVSWISGTVKGCADSVNKSLQIQHQYLNTVHSAGLTWLLTDQVTRRRSVGDEVQESLLDQVLCTEDALIRDFSIGPPLGRSDHVSIIVELNMFGDGSHCTNETEKHNWSKITDKEIIKLAHDIDWSYSNNVKFLSVEDMWNEFHSKLCLVTDRVPHCPTVSHDPNGNSKCKLPWSNSALKRSLKAKNKAWALFDSQPSRFNFSLALERQEIFENLECKAKVKFERKLTQDLKNNSKGFYSYIRNGRKVKSVVTNLEKNDGTQTKSDKDTAECFSDAFSSVFVNEPYGPLPEECYSPKVDNYEECGPLDISEQDVYYQLKKLNIYKSMGPDDIHPKLIKCLADNPLFVASLTMLYKKCIEGFAVPKMWKTANVIALHKKDSKKQALNYRPVSLTCILCKVYEQFIRNHVLNYVESRIISNQHGFVNKKSCFSNILETVDTIINMLEEGTPVDVFYFDFCKAFDSVPHYRLLTKLENYGITGPVLSIIKDFISDRSMRTVVRGSYSTIRNVLSGVPQGSVLGPLLFVLYINDLPNGLNNTSKLFADDLKLICNAANVNSIEADLACLERWEELWLIKFNTSKCKVMHLNFNNNDNMSHSLDGTVLDPIDEEKDLGLLTTCNLDWKENIYTCIKEANRMMAWITRNIVNKERNVMLNIFKTLVRPKLEYCVQIWNPVARHGNWSIIVELESVQRRFTRMINEIGTLPYSERLLALGLTTLAERRIRGDLIETFKVINGIVDYGKSVFNVSRSGTNIVSKAKYEGDTDRFRINELKFAFLPERVKSYWNNLPVSVKTSSSVNMFKFNLEMFKKESISTKESNFWDVSRVLLEKIEGQSYLGNKERHNTYLAGNPFVAKKRGINLYASSF